MSGLFSSTSISGSGLSAERLRMEVVANNIANAGSTRSENGGPYRRQVLVFAPNQANEFDRMLSPTGSLKGVRVVALSEDESDFEWVHNPGHPDANADGLVQMPNVKIPNEMVDLITASRSYEANLKALTLYKEMVEQTLNLLRGGR